MQSEAIFNMDENPSAFDDRPIDRSAGTTVLVIDDDPSSIKRIKLACSTANGLKVLEANSIQDGESKLYQEDVQVLLLDKELHLPSGRMDDGIDHIPSFLEINPGLQIVILTSSKDIQDCVRAMNFGASGFLTKDYPDEMILAQIQRHSEIAKLTSENIRRNRLETQGRKDLKLPGSSPSIQSLYNKLQAVSESSRPVLIMGETGTGKTTAAKIIHERRKAYLKQEGRPFLAINMGALSATVVERELFGNERGAFTDAKEARPGYFELANNGTLFLDEIGEAPLDLQVKLLKVLDDGKFFRIGGIKERSSSFKLICATNKDLEQMVRRGEFREDLFMRISTFVISIPPLHERPNDIAEIIKAVLPKVCTENNVHISFDDVPKDFLTYLSESPVPGNIRGIERQLSRLLVYAPKDKKWRPILSSWKKVPGLYILPSVSTRGKKAITLNDLKERKLDVVNQDFPGFHQFLREISYRVMLEAVDKTGSHQDAAKALKISPSLICVRLREAKKEGFVS